MLEEVVATEMVEADSPGRPSTREEWMQVFSDPSLLLKARRYAGAVLRNGGLDLKEGEDMVQTVAMRFLQKPPSVKSKPTQLFLSSVVNQARMRVRSFKKTKQVDLDPTLAADESIIGTSLRETDALSQVAQTPLALLLQEETRTQRTHFGLRLRRELALHCSDRMRAGSWNPNDYTYLARWLGYVPDKEQMQSMVDTDFEGIEFLEKPLSEKEGASLVGVIPSTAKSRAHRARHAFSDVATPRLKEMMRHLED